MNNTKIKERKKYIYTKQYTIQPTQVSYFSQRFKGLGEKVRLKCRFKNLQSLSLT